MAMTLFHLDDNTHLIAEVADRQDDPLRVRLGVSAVVRRRGTTRGRGQLAIDGPTDGTVIDVEPDGGVVNWLHVRRAIRVTELARERWSRRITQESSGKK